jgi:hypothetical protein
MTLPLAGERQTHRLSQNPNRCGISPSAQCAVDCQTGCAFPIPEKPRFATHMDIPNPIDAAHMTPAERLAEVCAILARGLVRLKARQSRQVSGEHGDSCLDFSPNQRRHGPSTNQTETLS